MVTATAARDWIDRWDRQQEVYIADREERFQVIADVVTAAAGREDPLVVDVGCGPGSLAVRLLDRLPAARVVGVDSDPVLLGLATAAGDGRPGLRLVDADLRAGWTGKVELDRPADAVVSTTALHWLREVELARVYADLARVLRPGGVFVDGDHVREGDHGPTLDRLAQAVRDGREGRLGASQGEQWADWWQAVEADAGLADLVRERAARAWEHPQDGGATYARKLALLREAGFAEAGTVWQSGDDRVLVAVRAGA